MNAVDAVQGRSRTYVLVHGAWFGAWVWTPVARRLRALGHEVHVPTLTGLGEKRHLLRPGINLDTHVDDVANVIEMEGLRDIVLVGWSYAGLVITDVLARLQPRIASMVYLDAFVPDRGKCQMDYANGSGTMASIANLAAEGGDVAPLPSGIWFTEQSEVDYVQARLGPQPALTLLQCSKALPIRPTGEIAHSFILAGEWAKRSRTFVPFYELMRADPNVHTDTWDVGHAMMWTHPERTADFLAAVR